MKLASLPEKEKITTNVTRPTYFCLPPLRVSFSSLGGWRGENENLQRGGETYVALFDYER